MRTFNCWRYAARCESIAGAGAGAAGIAKGRDAVAAYDDDAGDDDDGDDDDVGGGVSTAVAAPSALPADAGVIVIGAAVERVNSPMRVSLLSAGQAGRSRR